jgi:hypothetical protein
MRVRNSKEVFLCIRKKADNVGCQENAKVPSVFIANIHMLLGTMQ